MARRYIKSRTTPDMGWVVGTTRIDVLHQNSSADYETSGVFLFDFADVDPEALTGRIEADKSDWFIKRCVIDWAAAVGFANVTPTDVARRFQFGLGTMGIDSVEEVVSNDFPVIGPEVYNVSARTFRTYVGSVYAGCVIPLGVDADEDNVVMVGTTATSNGWGVTAPFWGPAGGHDDFEVSNAGLRNNQGMYWLVSTMPGPAPSYDWDTSDVLYMSLTYRVLLQKRR